MRRKGETHWLLWLFGILTAILGISLYSVKRRRRAHLDMKDAKGSFDRFLPAIVGVTQGTMTEGNALELLQNGKFFESLYRDLEAAKHTINFETFLCKKGEVSHRIASILSRKAREGVEVRMLLDGSGGKEIGKDDLDEMKEAGVDLRKYHPFEIKNLGVITNRDHRKLVIIDGRLGYIGGHCLVDNWDGDAQDKDHYRDISARVQGPVVQQIQSAFVENWLETAGDIPAGPHHFPKLEPKGESGAHVIWVSPSGSQSTVKLLHYMAIQGAKKRITIQNPYFLPEADMRNALIAAAKRGVEVRVMIPDPKISDAPIVQHASHHRYGAFLAGGVRLFDYQRTLLHQKVMTIDGIWSAIGSTNWDSRSFEFNDEATMGVYDEEIARQLEEIFAQDLEHAVERKADEWGKRELSHKLIDFSAYLVRDQL